MKHDFTKGPIKKSLLMLAIPIIIANIFHTVYQLTDTFWVGRLGADAVAAVSLSFPILFLLIQVGIGLTIAGSILISQYKGKREHAKIEYITGQTLILMLITAIFFSIVGYFSSEFFINLMKPEAHVAAEATKYLEISFIGFSFVAVFFVYQSVMRGVGDVKTPLLIVIGTVLLNFILDPFFIMGYGSIPGFGVSGAAIATLITEGISALIGIILLLSGYHGIHLKFRNLIPSMEAFKQLFKLGLPTSIEGSSRNISMVAITFLATSFGTLSIAAYGLGTRIFSFIIIPAIGLAMSTATIVGQNIGAGKMDRAEATMKESIKIGFYSLTFVGILTLIFAEPISLVFVPNDIDVAKESALFIKIMALTFGFVGVQMGAIGTLRGSGGTNAAMMLSIFTILIMVVSAYALAYMTPLGYRGIWWSYAISNAAGALLALMYITLGKWKEKQIIS